MKAQAQVAGRTPPTETSSDLPAKGKVLQRESTSDREGEKRRQETVLQHQGVNQVTPDGVPPVVHEVLHTSGQPLDPATRADMESRFGHDFSQVRIHQDDKAAQSAAAIQAQAYTVGRDIVLGPGADTAGDTGDKRLLAHELTHVTQQASGETAPPPDHLAIGDPADRLEQAADQAANRLAGGVDARARDDPAPNLPQSNPGVIQRQLLQRPVDTTLRVSPLMARSMGSLTLTNFATDSATLTRAHRTQLTGLAESLVSLREQYPGGTISIIGHTDATGSEAHNLDLGQRRADAVRDALVAEGVPAGMVGTSSQGEENLRVPTQRASGMNRRVEIQFQPEPIASLGVPPLSLDPNRVPVPIPPIPPIPPMGPETPEEKLSRILRELPPAPPERRSFDELFWERLDEGLDSAMSRFGVSRDLRPWIKRGVHAGIERGAEAIVNEVLDAAGVEGETREAIEQSIRATGETPLFR